MKMHFYIVLSPQLSFFPTLLWLLFSFVESLRQTLYVCYFMPECECKIDKRKVGENSLKRDREMTRARQEVKAKVRGALFK